MLIVVQVSTYQAELQELEATEQHLKRQQASLTDRLSRLEHQSSLKREAAASAVEEQLKEKEAIEAENAAARAKIAENEALVRSSHIRLVSTWILHVLIRLLLPLLLDSGGHVKAVVVTSTSHKLITDTGARNAVIIVSL